MRHDVKHPSIPKASEVLITGGAGFVGTHLARRLVSQGFRVVSLDLREPQAPVQGVRYIRGDVRDVRLLGELIDTAGVVYHLAATVSVPLCQKDPVESYSNNFTATLLVLDTIRGRAERTGEKPIPLVFASTAALYGNNGDDGRALAENDAASEFLSFYAAQKHASERAIELYARCFGVRATVFRFFNIYGPGQDPSSPYSGVITLFMKFAREGKALPLNGGGVQTRDFISVHDIVSACASVLEMPLERWDARPINLGTGRRITIRELGETIRRIHGGRSELVSAPPRDGDVQHSLADISRAREVLGFSPARELNESLREI